MGVRAPYLRVLGIRVETEGLGRASKDVRFTAEEEEEFRRLAAKPNVHEILAKSIAPSIYGSEDIKKVVSCLLFGGSRKILPDGLTRRGDINVLLLGDPGTAKSQLLKFVERVAPIAVYTSGKGSSAAGLTASVMRDAATRNFVVEVRSEVYILGIRWIYLKLTITLNFQGWRDGAGGRRRGLHRRVR